jgi:hypothetical protein
MRLLMERRLLVPLTLLVAAAVPVFASCAEAEDSRPADHDASVSLPEAGVGDAPPPIDVPSDGGCDASEPSCVSEVLTCDQAAWCPVPTTVSTRFALTSVWGSGPNDVWAVGSGGTIIHWNGSAWEPTPTNLKNTFYAVWGSGPNDVWATSTTDAIFHSTGFANGKAEWTRAPNATEGPYSWAVQAIWGDDTGALRLGTRAQGVGWQEYINQYTLNREAEGGMAWDPVYASGNVHGFWGAAKDLWFVADNSEANGWEKGRTMHGVWNGEGLAWTPVDSQAMARLEGIWGGSADDIWAVGELGTMRRMRTRGASRWEIIESPTKEGLHAIWGTAADDIWAVGDAGTILHFDGTTWKHSQAAFALGKKPDLFGVWGSSKNDVWIVGDNVALHYTGPKPGAQGGGQ